jgi:hypothetical protein
MNLRLATATAAAVVILAACGTASNPFAGPTSTPEIGLLVQRTAQSQGQSSFPSLQAQATNVAEALTLSPPILVLSGLDDLQSQAQLLAVADPRFRANVLNGNGEPLRNEIFGVYPARQSDLTDATLRCTVARCFRVEMYNYATNLASVAIVDVDDRQVLAVNHVADTQPDIPTHLRQLALDIATHAPQVVEALGFQPSADMALMASTKTSLSATRCQRSHHLCVAPTFVKDGRALWAIVDLTDGVLAGIRWTAVGTVPGAVTERSLQNDVVTALYCDRTTSLNRSGWTMNYILTSSDGLEVTAVRYKDQPILDSAKLVDWHVSYSTQDGFGYSDAVGCPVFSQAAVVAFEGPTLEDIRVNGVLVGFALRQKFWSDLWPLPCNYYYEQRFEFYDDGRYRVVAGNDGRGCGDQGTYRPVLRMAFGGANTLAAWDGSTWRDWSTEQYQFQDDGHATPDGYQYRLLTTSGRGYYIEPGAGQFGDGGRGDNAYLYLTRRHADREEGDANMITIGPCCNQDYRQGPERFIDTPPESTVGQSVVVWYVPQMQIDSAAGHEYCWAQSELKNGVYVGKTYPCYAGPMFVPVP